MESFHPMASLKAQQKMRQNHLKQKKKREEEDENPVIPRTKHKVHHSMFSKLNPDELMDKRKEAMLPIEKRPFDSLETSVDSYYPSDCLIEFPTRPRWDSTMTKEEVETQEEKYFEKWLHNVKTSYSNENLSFFEENLEVWRQLWRVVEMSDIVLVVCDIRNPLLHFPPTLYQFVVKKHRKHLMVVLNKIDLVDDETIHHWKSYFEHQFPGLIVTTFSCDPKSKEARKMNYRRFFRAVGVLDILQACKSLSIPNKVSVDWDSLMESMQEDLEQRDRRAHEAELRALNGRGGNRENKTNHGRRRKQIENQDDSDTEGSDDDEELVADLEQLTVKEPHSYVTIGMVGHPNVGKSSLIVQCANVECLQGKKVCICFAYTRPYKALPNHLLVGYCETL
jgi:ribosome biogenesis GTPase A